MDAAHSRTTYPIHSWVLFFLVGLCLAFGLYPIPPKDGPAGPALSHASPPPGAPAILSEVEPPPPEH